MKVICCDVECNPTIDDKDDPSFIFPIAKVVMMGLTHYELRACWYVCPTCGKSYLVLPWESPVENAKRYVATWMEK